MNSIIVVPCYNEEKRLKTESFIEFSNQNPDLDFIFVNDGSSDSTLKVLESLCQGSERLNYLNLEKNSGKAEAIRQAMLHTFKLEKKYDFFAFYDADLATPLYELRALADYAYKKNVHMLLGTRFKHLGANINRKVYRHYLGRIFATIVSTMLKLPVYDTQCGAKFLSRDVIETCFTDSFRSMWFFDVECLFRLKKKRKFSEYRIYERPLKEWTDVQGSKLTFWDFLKVPLELFKLQYFYKIR